MRVAVNNKTNNKISNNIVKQIVMNDLANRPLKDIIELSVTFVSKNQAQKLNIEYRGKDYIPDILTFGPPINEIIICPAKAKLNGHKIPYLIKHGLNHLRGIHH